MEPVAPHYPFPSRLVALRAMASGFGHPVQAMALRLLALPGFSDWSGSSRPDQHHYGRGGLQHHTYEVASMALANAASITAWERPVDTPVLFLACLYHDVGKLWDYEPTDATLEHWRGTSHKRLIHHISRSALHFNQIAAEERLPDGMRDSITHAILAHHGAREHGSPVFPKTREAWLLHLCDGLSARSADCDRWDLVHGKPKP